MSNKAEVNCGIEIHSNSNKENKEIKVEIKASYDAPPCSDIRIELPGKITTAACLSNKTIIEIETKKAIVKIIKKLFPQLDDKDIEANIHCK